MFKYRLYRLFNMSGYWYNVVIQSYVLCCKIRTTAKPKWALWGSLSSLIISMTEIKPFQSDTATLKCGHGIWYQIHRTGNKSHALKSRDSESAAYTSKYTKVCYWFLWQFNTGPVATLLSPYFIGLDYIPWTDGCQYANCCNMIPLGSWYLGILEGLVRKLGDREIVSSVAMIKINGRIPFVHKEGMCHFIMMRW